ncbi:hypothetical protein DL768_000131 [Monosporascus sp. mg162]|nr:hypothetical protein DL768_000131 [Monosporascus sp. mg162]
MATLLWLLLRALEARRRAESRESAGRPSPQRRPEAGVFTSERPRGADRGGSGAPATSPPTLRMATTTAAAREDRARSIFGGIERARGEGCATPAGELEPGDFTAGLRHLDQHVQRSPGGTSSQPDKAMLKRDLMRIDPGYSALHGYQGNGPRRPGRSLLPAAKADKRHPDPVRLVGYED